MGATSQKSIKNILDSKYSFSHPKSSMSFQVSVWKYTEEELESGSQPDGISMKWPFKFYADEGYIVALIENRAAKEQKNVKKNSQMSQFQNIRASLNIMDILYSFSHGQLEEYLQQRVCIDSESKYLKDKLTLWLYVYTGQNLSAASKIKLISQAVGLQRYIARGGLCSISKLFHQFETLTDLSRQIRLQGDEIKSKEEDYYVAIETLLQSQIKSNGEEKDKQGEKLAKSQLWKQLQSYSLLNKTIFNYHFREGLLLNKMPSSGTTQLYPIVEAGSFGSNTPLIVASSKKNVQSIQKPIEPVPVKKVSLDESSPFACEITEINVNMEKKKGGFMNESNLMQDLSVLNDRKSQFVRIVSPEDDCLILTTYQSMHEYKQLVEYNIRLVLNLAPNFCFDYYLNDLQYLNYYLAPLPSKQPADAILFENNIQHMLMGSTHAIIGHTVNNKYPNSSNNFNNNVLIHSNGGVFSDQNVAVVIGYYILRYLYPYEKAFAIVNRAYQEYTRDKGSQLGVHKVYVSQLMTLQNRVLVASLPDYRLTLNTACWRAYQVSNNHSSLGQTLIARYIGQVSNLNQLTSLPNYSKHFYIVLSNQLVSTLTPLIQRWQQDPTIKAPTNIPGIKILTGKDFNLRDLFLAKTKQMISLMLKYELVNRSQCPQSFNNEFLFKFIEGIVQSNIQAQSIQKSFRKPQPLTPLYQGFEEETPTAPQEKVVLPYNPKEKLVFKYPFLRPTWEPLKDDEYYYVLQVTKNGASVQLVKGKNWAGYEMDKQTFFASIVELYLVNIEEEKIWIAQQGDQSLFGDQLHF